MEDLSTMNSGGDKNMRKSSRVSYMTQVMEPQIWEKFPEELLEHVLVRLPIVTLLQFRTVCQLWNTLITSQSFSLHRAQVSQENPWFYITFRNNEAMYEPFAKRWYYPVTLEIPADPISSAGSLVCFFDCVYGNLYVCNPLTMGFTGRESGGNSISQCNGTQYFKKLPAGSIKGWDRLSGIAMNGIGGYKVLRLSNDYRDYEIYDSVTENWSHQEKIPECIKKPNYIHRKSVSIDSTVYFKYKVPEGIGIISCNTSTGVWTQHLIQDSLHSSDFDLVESDGRIMLVGLLTENNAQCVCIWEVQKVTFLLKEVDRWPCSEFLGSRGRVFYMTCWGNKGLLLCWLRSYKKHWMVTYNIATRKWEMVDVPHGSKKLYGIAFQPSLTAMP